MFFDCLIIIQATNYELFMTHITENDLERPRNISEGNFVKELARDINLEFRKHIN